MLLRELNSATIGVRQRYPVKVLQFGDGNFLRGFADWMIDILNERAGFEAGVTVVAPLRQGKPAVADKQDGLYHVALKGIIDGKPVDDIRLIRCIDGYVDPYSEHERFIMLGTLPELKLIISNATEAGITFDDNDTRPDAPPASFPAKVTQLLFKRYSAFNGAADKGVVIIPCELIEQNGATLEKVVLQYAGYWKLPAAFHDWMKDSCVFCNSLVDRIVTGYPKDNADQITQRMGYNDLRLVAAEPYHLWVIEGDTRVREVLPADKAGLNVKFVPDLTPYRTSKVRILNGAHTAMTLIGYLRGLRTVREAVEDPWMASYLDGLIRHEIIPTIPLPANELKEYARQVFERFSNPGITHELTSIALNSVSKFRTRLLPALLGYHRLTGKLPDHLVHAFGALVVFYRGTWKGQPLPVNDHPDVMKTMAAYWNPSGEVDVHSMLTNVTLWGTDLSEVDHLTDGLLENIASISAEA